MNALVIHGVNNRDKQNIEKHAAHFKEQLSHVNFIPCYWGDLGADIDLDIITTQETQTLSSFSRTVILNEALSNLSAELDPKLVEDELDVYLDSPELEKLKELIQTSENVEENLGNLIAEAYNLTPAELEEAESLSPSGLMRFLKPLERTLRFALEANLTRLKNDISKQGFNFFGDALKYQKNPEPFWNRVRETIGSLGINESEPIDVIAHSLGGVITFDMAMKEQLWIGKFITMGSQAAFFHQLVQSSSFSKPLKPTIKTWHNFYENLDALAYKASKFILFDEKTRPIDIPIYCKRVLTHGCYWENETVLRHLLQVYKNY